MPTFLKPSIPLPAWGDEFPDALQISLKGNAIGLPGLSYAGRTVTFNTEHGSTVSVAGMLSGTTVEVTSTSGTDEDTNSFTMPAEGVEVTVTE